MKAISFSLYTAQADGNVANGAHLNPYLMGIVRNAYLLQDIYPEWVMVVFCDPAVSKDTINALEKHGAEVRITEGCSMFHRFLINDDPKVERYLIRDADSRLNQREAGAVAEWIDSGRSFHVIRDHPHHPQPIMGGLWGGVTGKINVANLLAGINIKDRTYMADMRFLAQRVWPAIKNDCLQHDLVTWRQYPGSKHFKASFDDPRFCGERWKGNEEPFPGEWERRMNFCSV